MDKCRRGQRGSKSGGGGGIIVELTVVYLLCHSKNDVTFKNFDQNSIMINHKAKDDFKSHIILILT
jgi:hypothetical protein